MKISTGRLLLRDANSTDALSLAEYQSDQSYLKCYDSPPDAEALVRTFMDWATEVPRRNYQFIIVTRCDSRVMGCVGLRSKGYSSGIAEIGIELAPDQWGKGYAIEAIDALIEFAESLGIEELTSSTHYRNQRAQQLVNQFGFTVGDRVGDQITYNRRTASGG